MGWFSSKTITSVASTTSPMFDRNKRIDNFEAAMIDHTTTNSMEQSEYLRAHYKNSRLQNILGFRNWADRTGFTGSLGKIQATFYGDAKLDYTAITEALRPLISFPANVDSFAVYDAQLFFFSEDFWIKHLATQQGKANWLYDPQLTDYTISYPSDGYIRATFKNGKYIEGKLPNYTPSTRFLDISYNIIVSKTESKPGEKPEDPPITTTTYEYIYGFYAYQEKTGSSTLDSIIANNGIKGTQTFYPVIPLRTNTWWITDGRASHINDALIQLQLYDAKKGKDNAFKVIRDTCEKEMKGGSIGDIDYITLLLGISINTRNLSDQKYLFEFFFNCYTNYAISIGEKPQSFIGGKPLYTNSGSFGWFHRKIIEALRGGQEDNYYTKFQLYNGTSNFNYTYGWLTADYFEANGQYKPNAKVGTYGVLAGKYTYTYRHQVPARDNEGNVIVRGDSESGYEVVMEWETVTTSYNLTLFCYQASKNRWKALAFADLKLVNMIYAGKAVNTDAYDAVKDSSETRTLDHDFTGDYDGAYQTWNILNFTYVENPGDSDSAFVVPLEENTLYECGAKDALDISYGCYFLVFNCWVQKKKKWYQNGIFGAIIGFIGMVFFPPSILWTFSAIVFTVSITVVALNLTTKLLSFIFGERWAVRIVKLVLKVVKVVVNVIASIAIKIPVIGWLVWGICMTVIFTLTAAEVLWLGGTWKDALKQALISTTVSAASSIVGGQLAGSSSLEGVGNSLSTSGAGWTIAGQNVSTGQLFASTMGSSFTQSFLEGVFTGQSIGDAFKDGFKSAAVAGITTGLAVGLNLAGFSKSLQGQACDFSKLQALSVGEWFGLAGNMALGQLININTFANLLQMSMEERQFHKMANLENDYQEFNNKAAVANKVLNQLAEAVSGTTTAEAVVRMQACLGRMTSSFPDTNQSMDPEAFLSVATLAGSDVCKVVLGNIDCWCDSKLTMDGYSPSDLHYSTFSNTLTWDASLSIGV